MFASISGIKAYSVNIESISKQRNCQSHREQWATGQWTINFNL